MLLFLRSETPFNISITFFLQGDQRTNINHIPDSEVTVVLVNHNQDGKENQFLALNDRTIIQWLNLVWFANVPSSSLLLADSFHTHTSSLTQKFMVSRGACLAIIPSACSHKLQPLNRGIKHKFKVPNTKIQKYCQYYLYCNTFSRRVTHI